MGLKLRCQCGCLPLWTLTFPASRGHLHSFAHVPFFYFWSHKKDRLCIYQGPCDPVGNISSPELEGGSGGHSGECHCSGPDTLWCGHHKALASAHRCLRQNLMYKGMRDALKRMSWARACLCMYKAMEASYFCLAPIPSHTIFWDYLSILQHTYTK